MIVLALVAATAAILSAALIRLLRPLLLRYALARPNARSSHAAPTPQGGGIAVVAAALAAAAAALEATGGAPALAPLAVPALAAAGLAVVGGVDDIRPLPAWPRLALQAVAVAAVVLSGGGRVLPDAVPLGLERAILILAGLWWVNLVNFMDGIDWITVAEFVPVCAALALFGLAGSGSAASGTAAAALAGALLGFAPANRPVARLFLGDVGSLPIGLLSGWMLLELARSGALAAALLLPLYHLADATLTLLRRLRRRERVWEAHRTHAYQRARDNGFSVRQIDQRVFGLNLLLAGLAAATVRAPAPAITAVCLIAGAALVALTLRRFGTPRLGRPP